MSTSYFCFIRNILFFLASFIFLELTIKRNSLYFEPLMHQIYRNECNTFKSGTLLRATCCSPRRPKSIVRTWSLVKRWILQLGSNNPLVSCLCIAKFNFLLIFTTIVFTLNFVTTANVVLSSLDLRSFNVSQASSFSYWFDAISYLHHRLCMFVHDISIFLWCYIESQKMHHQLLWLKIS